MKNVTNRMIALERTTLRSQLLIDFTKELAYPDLPAKDVVSAAAALADETVAEIERYSAQVQNELRDDDLPAVFEQMMDEIFGRVPGATKQ